MTDVVESPRTGDAQPPDLAGKRRLVLFDVLYLLVLTWLYSLSLLTPLFGIVLGIILMSWGATDESRRIGRVCLILGVINIGLTLVIMTIFVAVGGIMSHWPGNLMTLSSQIGGRVS